MAFDQQNMVLGTNSPKVFTLVDTRSASGVAGGNFSGCTNFEGFATPSAGGTVVPVTISPILLSAGTFTMRHTLGAFNATGMYTVRVRFKDGSGNTHEEPADGSMRLNIIA